MLAEFNSDGIGMMLAVLWCKGTFSCSLEDNRDESASQMEEEHSLAFDFSHFLSFFFFERFRQECDEHRRVCDCIGQKGCEW